MSFIHGKWSVDDIRNVIRSLDEKTGMDGAALPIFMYTSLGSGSTLASYQSGPGMHCFSFSRAYFNDPACRDLAVIEATRQVYCHYLVNVLDLKKVYEDPNPYGIAWKTVCGLLNTDWRGTRNPCSPCHFSMDTEEMRHDALKSADIPPIDIPGQIARWGRELPSIARRKYLEHNLIRKYTRARVFSENDTVMHDKLGRGIVLDTMPADNKQLLYVRFESGKVRVVQNRQVCKIVNGQVKKPAGRGGKAS